jgi:DNA repair protein RecN (Recombination protein N)
MLLRLNIRNYLMIKALNVEFQPGFTAITGETGAGKSKIIEAIALALGARMKPHAQQNPQEQCEISVEFDINQSPKAKQWLNCNHFNADNCILVRIFQKNGRSRSLINGRPCPLQQMLTLGKLLCHSHSQHQNLELFDSSTQLNFFDAHAKLNSETKQVTQAYQHWKLQHTTRKELEETLQKQKDQFQLWKYYAQELSALNLEKEDFKTILEKQERQHNLKECEQTCADSLNLLDLQPQYNAKYSINQALEKISTCLKHFPELKNIHESLQQAETNIQEAINELHSIHKALEHNQWDEENYDEALKLRFELARKHQVKPENLYQFYEKLMKDIELSSLNEQNLMKSITSEEESLAHFHTVAKALSCARKDHSESFSNTLQQGMQKLNMPYGSCQIKWQIRSEPHSTGLDILDLTIKTNPESNYDSISNIASGGECSRLNLVLQSMAHHDLEHSAPTLLFDEVDTGVGGGESAECMGKMLRSLAKKRQIISITHQPQIVVFGNNHLKVSKHYTNGQTEINIDALNQEQLENEIARMLDGKTPMESSLLHAKNIIKKQYESAH